MTTLQILSADQGAQVHQHGLQVLARVGRRQSVPHLVTGPGLLCSPATRAVGLAGRDHDRKETQ